jgi:hypothetical protein
MLLGMGFMLPLPIFTRCMVRMQKSLKAIINSTSEGSHLLLRNHTTVCVALAIRVTIKNVGK